MKAKLNAALCARTRRSQARASEAPAPAAIPFTAQTTGLSMVASVEMIGL